jgi:hypothetical protein
MLLCIGDNGGQLWAEGVEVLLHYIHTAILPYFRGGIYHRHSGLKPLKRSRFLPPLKPVGFHP